MQVTVLHSCVSITIACSLFFLHGCAVSFFYTGTWLCSFVRPLLFFLCSCARLCACTTDRLCDHTVELVSQHSPSNSTVCLRIIFTVGVESSLSTIEQPSLFLQKINENVECRVMLVLSTRSRSRVDLLVS